MEINHLILFGQNIGIFGLIIAAYPTPPHIGLVRGGASGHCHISAYVLHNISRFKNIVVFFHGHFIHNYEKD